MVGILTIIQQQNNMRKLIIISLMLIGMMSKAQQYIGNIIIVQNSDSVSCSFKSALDTSYHGGNEYITKQLIADSLGAEFNDIKALIKSKYPNSDTCQYLNTIQSFLDYELFNVIIKDESNVVKLSELSPEIQQATYYFGLKVISIIQKRYYYEN